jgi:hypothetical protein
MSTLRKISGLLVFWASTAGVMTGQAPASPITEKVVSGCGCYGSGNFHGIDQYDQEVHQRYQKGETKSEQEEFPGCDAACKNWGYTGGALKFDKPVKPAAQEPTRKIVPDVKGDELIRFWYEDLKSSLQEGKVADALQAINALLRDVDDFVNWFGKDKPADKAKRLFDAAFTSAQPAQQTTNYFEPLVAPMAKLLLALPANVWALYLGKTWLEVDNKTLTAQPPEPARVIFIVRVLFKMLELDCASSQKPRFLSEEAVTALRTKGEWQVDHHEEGLLKRRGGAFEIFLLNTMGTAGRNRASQDRFESVFYPFDRYGLPEDRSVKGSLLIGAGVPSDAGLAIQVPDYFMTGCPLLRNINWEQAIKEIVEFIKKQIKR